VGRQGLERCDRCVWFLLLDRSIQQLRTALRARRHADVPEVAGAAAIEDLVPLVARDEADDLTAPSVAATPSGGA
jgi:hypothetical protein